MSTSLASVAGKAAGHLATWSALQDAMQQLCANFENILQRMPALRKASNFLELLQPEQMQQEIMARTLASMDNVLKRLHEKLSDMAEVVRAQEKLCVSAWSALRNSAALPTYIQPQPMAQPNTAQLVEALEDVWYMCRDELCLKAAALAHLHPGLTQDEAASLLAILSGRCHERPASMSMQLLINWAAMY